MTVTGLDKLHAAIVERRERVASLMFRRETDGFLKILFGDPSLPRPSRTYNVATDTFSLDVLDDEPQPIIVEAK